MRRSAVDRPRSSLPERIVPGEEVAERKDGPGRELAPVDRHAEAGLDAPGAYLPPDGGNHLHQLALVVLEHEVEVSADRGWSNSPSTDSFYRKRPTEPPAAPLQNPVFRVPRPPRDDPNRGSIIEGSEGKDRAAIRPGWDAEHPLFQRFRKNDPVRGVL